MTIGKTLYEAYKRTGLSTKRRHARYLRIAHALGLRDGERVLEIGCARGIDFAQFAVKTNTVVGVDVADVERVCDFEFHRIDARSLPWPDRSFDCVVSIGALEHIQPMDVLCEVTREVRRLGKRFCVIVPAAGTIIEPHTFSVLWHLRDGNRKRPCEYELNYFSDEAWLQFPGFVGARTRRYWHAPGIQNLMIFSNGVEDLVDRERLESSRTV